jgi:hypothetical protein
MLARGTLEALRLRPGALRLAQRRLRSQPGLRASQTGTDFFFVSAGSSTAAAADACFFLLLPWMVSSKRWAFRGFGPFSCHVLLEAWR